MSESEIPDLIRWNSGIELGIKSLDTQHRHLVGLLNKLNRAMIMRKGRQAMDGLLSDLIDYTKQHFGTEEKLMRQYDYAERNEHETQHRHFAEKMIGLQQQVTNGDAMVTMDLMSFLKKWLVNHIMGTDKKYQAFFNSKGVA